MPSIIKSLNEELRRLARKEIKASQEELKNTVKQLRQTVSSLNKRVANLEKDNKRLVSVKRKTIKAGPKVSEEDLDRAPRVQSPARGSAKDHRLHGNRRVGSACNP